MCPPLERLASATLIPQHVLSSDYLEATGIEVGGTKQTSPHPLAPPGISLGTTSPASPGHTADSAKRAHIPEATTRHGLLQSPPDQPYWGSGQICATAALHGV